MDETKRLEKNPLQYDTHTICLRRGMVLEQLKLIFFF